MSENPYDPPHVDSAEPGRYAPPEPSGVAKTMGILSIVFGSLVLVYDLYTFATISMQRQFRPRFGHPDPQDLAAAEELTRQIMPYEMGATSAMLVMSIALIVIGVGLTKQKAIARTAAVYWSMLGFVVLGVRAYVFETRIWPKMQPFMQQIVQRAMERQHQTAKDMAVDPQALGQTIGHATVYVQLVILAFFPALMLLLLNLPSVKERLRNA
jgi:hypothetical protein